MSENQSFVTLITFGVAMGICLYKVLMCLVDMILTRLLPKILVKPIAWCCVGWLILRKWWKTRKWWVM